MASPEKSEELVIEKKWNAEGKCGKCSFKNMVHGVACNALFFFFLFDCTNKIDICLWLPASKNEKKKF